MRNILLWLLILCINSSLYGQLNTTFLGQLTYGPDLSDIWGYYDAAADKEYALVGLTNGFSIVDVTDPATPTQVANVPGVYSVWRDIKTWQHYAYVVNETGGGLLIVDMSNLPAITTTTWNGGGFQEAHNIYIDENGFGYLIGANTASGCTIIDLNSDPLNPTIVGSYSPYVHDAFVRGDTLWACHIYLGEWRAIDISDKSNPQFIGSHDTPHDFTHACWLSDDGNYLYAVDEEAAAYITAYDVSDAANPFETDRIRTAPGNVIPHNVFYIDGFVVTSYYTAGITITDVSNPNILVEVGKYDSSPYSGSGFYGVWGVYPYLPSGNIVVSDSEQGLFILGADYVEASYLEGNVTNSVNSNPINAVSVDVTAVDNEETNTNFLGDYTTGIPGGGTYNVVFSAPGYYDYTAYNVIMTEEATTTLDVQLVPLDACLLDFTAIDYYLGGVSDSSCVIRAKEYYHTQGFYKVRYVFHWGTPLSGTQQTDITSLFNGCGSSANDVFLRIQASGADAYTDIYYYVPAISNFQINSDYFEFDYDSNLEYNGTCDAAYDNTMLKTNGSVEYDLFDLNWAKTVRIMACYHEP